MLEHHSIHEAAFETPAGLASSEELRALESRLERGWDVISTAERLGKGTDALVHHFLDLLRQYEHLYDRRRGF